MDALILSDLHFELNPNKINSFFQKLRTPADILILAGDICAGYQIPAIAKLACSKYEHVIYVHGNHEFYRHTREEVLSYTNLAVSKNPGFHWLDCSEITVGNTRFLGATLWFREQFSVPKNYLNDFKQIRGDFSNWVYEENARAIEYIRRNARPLDVVITHHLPSHRSVPLKYIADPGNCYFVCDMEGVIFESTPSFWIHGHTHSSFDYKLGETRIIANPRGYGNENAQDFRIEKVVDITES
ncbi:MAG TPA: metallophosphoesterase [Methylobacter sp.]|jgi:Icc-related predicted phosphoesterase